ncbi:MAG TPA: M56 family metallopeptidase [Bryobacteraceae bacterium]
MILPPDWPQWPQARLDAVLAHEREHAGRRDPLWQLLALVNRALFWFHPLAWWLERKLSELAEEACDAAVLVRGFDAGNYSECLVDLARSVQRSGRRIGALSATMPGIGLEHRIRTMLSGAIAQRVSRVRMVCAVGLCVSAVAVFSAGTLVRAQDATKGHVEFEVASIRPANQDGGGVSKSKDGGGGGRGPGIPIAIGHGRFNYSDTLRGLIMQAYHVTACPPRADTCPLISGGPSWINKDYFDIQAKTPEGTPDYTFFQLMQGKAPEIQLMLQALLVDRFNLKFHREKKQMPVYALSVGKKGPKLKKSGEVEKAQLPSGLVIESRGLAFVPVLHPNGDRTIRLSAKNSSMQDVADALAMFIFTRPVINRTGIDGEFDFTVEYSAEGDQPAADLAGPELFTALQEQAGLKLEATRAVVDVLVIDHAEKPSEN